MSNGEMLYLAMVCSSFGILALVLAIQSVHSSRNKHEQ